MKKLCKKGKVHPSPESDLSFLPATILTLAAALSPEDRRVLAYLISCCGSSTNNNNNNTTADDHYKATTDKSFGGGGGGGGGDGDGEHPPLFDCNCFRCYKSFWVRWDTSPNRQLIHEIIEAYEEGLFRENYNNNNKKSLKKKKKKRGKRVCDDDDDELIKDVDQSVSPEVMISTGGDTATAAAENIEEGHREDDGDGGDKLEVEQKGSVTKIVNFLGERIWNFWSIN